MVLLREIYFVEIKSYLDPQAGVFYANNVLSMVKVQVKGESLGCVQILSLGVLIPTYHSEEAVKEGVRQHYNARLILYHVLLFTQLLLNILILKYFLV